MKKQNEQLINAVKPLFSIFILVLALILINHFFGICYIHEPGHLTAGKMFGCNNLSIQCSSKFTMGLTIDQVLGWSDCPGLAINIDGSRVCSYKSYIIGIFGFLFTVIVLMFFLIIIYLLLKKFFPKWVSPSFWILGIILIILEAFGSASSDFAKIIACFYSKQDISYLTSLFFAIPPKIMTFIIAIWIFIFILGLIHRFCPKTLKIKQNAQKPQKSVLSTKAIKNRNLYK